jgi:hypothetical protein
MQLSMALYKNGLLQSKYAQDKLNELKPLQKRPDQISTIKFQHE